MTPGAHHPDEHPRQDLFRKASGFLLGTAASSMFFNLLSASIGYRGVAAVALTAALITMIRWLRRLPARAPLTRAAVPVLIALALTCELTSLITAWATTAATAAVLAVLFLLAAAGLTAALEHAIDLVRSIAFVGMGISVFYWGAIPPHPAPLYDAALIGAGITMVVFGVADLRRAERLTYTAFVGLGIVIVGLGAVPPHPAPLYDAVTIGLGIAFIGVAVSLRPGSSDVGPLTDAALITLGIMTVGAGAVPPHSTPLYDAALIGAGITMVVFGVADLRRAERLTYTALIGVGIAVIGMGAVPPHNHPLNDAAIICLGISATGYGAYALNNTGFTIHAAQRLIALTQEPAPPQSDPPHAGGRQVWRRQSPGPASPLKRLLRPRRAAPDASKGSSAGRSEAPQVLAICPICGQRETEAAEP